MITLFTAAILLTSCNVKKEDSGEMPDVDVNVTADAGELPEYEVNWADVDVTTTTRTVEIPKLVVVMEEEEVEVPVIDVDVPGEKEERTLLVEAEVSGKEHDLEIQHVHAKDKKLYVVAKLTEMDRELQDQTLRIQDQVDINAPMMDVEYIIVGERPDRVFNKNNTYVNSMNDVNDRIKNSQLLYKK